MSTPTVGNIRTINKGGQLTTIDTNMCRHGGELTSSDPAGDQMIDDLLDAIAQGIDAGSYLDARAAGITHAQAIETTRWGWRSSDPLQICARVLRAGGTFAEVRSLNTAPQTGVPVNPDLRAKVYVSCREKGMTHSEFLTPSDYRGRQNMDYGFIDEQIGHKAYPANLITKHDFSALKLIPTQPHNPLQTKLPAFKAKK
jgi:hypothetical protein